MHWRQLNIRCNWSVQCRKCIPANVYGNTATTIEMSALFTTKTACPVLTFFLQDISGCELFKCVHKFHLTTHFWSSVSLYLTLELFRNFPQYKNANIANFVSGVLLELNNINEVCDLKMYPLKPTDRDFTFSNVLHHMVQIKN